MRAVLLAALCTLALAGCGHGRGKTTIGTTLRIADDVFPTAQADDECFAAVPGLVVVGQAADGTPAACDAVAARYFVGRRRLAWSPPLLKSTSGRTTDCFMRRGDETLAVVRAERKVPTLARAICADLRARGWRPIPLG